METIKVILVATLVGLFASCATYDTYSYDQTVKLKNETIQLMEAGNESYSLHSNNVDGLRAKIDSLYNYEKSRNNNLVSVKMWEILKKDNGLVFGFFQRWKASNSLNQFFIREAVKQTSISFDEIIQTEENKK